MKQLFLLIALLAPMAAQACEWKVKVTDNTTKEIKYYLANSTERTEFGITTGDGKPFAACTAKLQPEKIKEEHKKFFTKAETGVLLCAYKEALSYPIAVSATRFVYADKPEKNNMAIMTLFSVPDKGQKLKPLFTIQYACRSY